MASIISGTGMAIPERVVTNDDLSEIMDTTDEWISSRSGVKQRHLSLPGHGSSELAAHAGTAAIKDAGLHESQIDALITATMTPDYYAPGIVALVQERIGLGAIPAFDLRQQCCGFLYGLDLADSLITSDRAENALVVGAEAHVGFIPWGKPKSDGSLPVPDEKQREVNNRTRGWSVLFGDGSGAMVVRRGEGNDGVIASRLFTDGSQPGLILVPGVGSVQQPYVDQAQLDGELHLPVMDGAGLYRSAVRLMPEAVRQVCEKAGIEVGDLDLVIAHQANDRILEGVRKHLDLPAKKVPSNIARYGNTTAGTLPILFHELRQQGQVGPGALVCFTAFGAGAHWGAVLYREPEANPPARN
ncbi:MAG: 3-oxoacyl-ACP synthase III family protein [Acidimicrobiia bacterium]